MSGGAQVQVEKKIWLYASNKTKFSPLKQVFQRQIFHGN